MDRVFDASRVAHLIGDHLCDQLRISGSTEDLPPCLIFIPKLAGVHQVAVVGNGDVLITEEKIEGLGVFRPVCSCRGIPDMPEPDVAFKAVQYCRIENLGDETLPPVFMEPRPVKCRDPRALLPAVLEGKQGIIDRERHTASIPDANDSAHVRSLMGRDLWSLVYPVVLSHPRAFTKPAGRADLVPQVVGYAPAPSAGNMDPA